MFDTNCKLKEISINNFLISSSINGMNPVILLFITANQIMYLFVPYVVRGLDEVGNILNLRT
jgi:hypothetical protein